LASAEFKCLTHEPPAPLDGHSVRTQKVYMRAVRQLANHFRRTPDQLTEIREYFLFLKNDKKLASASVKILSANAAHPLDSVRWLATLHADEPFILDAAAKAPPPPPSLLRCADCGGGIRVQRPRILRLELTS
jgi:hypothetical protein